MLYFKTDYLVIFSIDVLSDEEKQVKKQAVAVSSNEIKPISSPRSVSSPTISDDSKEPYIPGESQKNRLDDSDDMLNSLNALENEILRNIQDMDNLQEVLDQENAEWSNSQKKANNPKPQVDTDSPTKTPLETIEWHTSSINPIYTNLETPQSPKAYVEKSSTVIQVVDAVGLDLQKTANQESESSSSNEELGLGDEQFVDALEDAFDKPSPKLEVSAADNNGREVEGNISRAEPSKMQLKHDDTSQLKNVSSCENKEQEIESELVKKVDNVPSLNTSQAIQSKAGTSGLEVVTSSSKNKMQLNQNEAVASNSKKENTSNDTEEQLGQTEVILTEENINEQPSQNDKQSIKDSSENSSQVVNTPARKISVSTFSIQLSGKQASPVRYLPDNAPTNEIHDNSIQESTAQLILKTSPEKETSKAPSNVEPTQEQSSNIGNSNDEANQSVLNAVQEDKDSEETFKNSLEIEFEKTVQVEKKNLNTLHDIKETDSSDSQRDEVIEETSQEVVNEEKSFPDHKNNTDFTESEVKNDNPIQVADQMVPPVENKDPTNTYLPPSGVKSRKSSKHKRKSNKKNKRKAEKLNRKESSSSTNESSDAPEPAPTKERQLSPNDNVVNIVTKFELASGQDEVDATKIAHRLERKRPVKKSDSKKYAKFKSMAVRQTPDSPIEEKAEPILDSPVQQPTQINEPAACKTESPEKDLKPITTTKIQMAQNNENVSYHKRTSKIPVLTRQNSISKDSKPINTSGSKIPVRLSSPPKEKPGNNSTNPEPNKNYEQIEEVCDELEVATNTLEKSMKNDPPPEAKPLTETENKNVPSTSRRSEKSLSFQSNKSDEDYKTPKTFNKRMSLSSFKTSFDSNASSKQMSYTKSLDNDSDSSVSESNLEELLSDDEFEELEEDNNNNNSNSEEYQNFEERKLQAAEELNIDLDELNERVTQLTNIDKKNTVVGNSIEETSEEFDSEDEIEVDETESSDGGLIIEDAFIEEDDANEFKVERKEPTEIEVLEVRNGICVCCSIAFYVSKIRQVTKLLIDLFTVIESLGDR